MKVSKLDHYTFDIIEELQTAKTQEVINPSQDFIRNGMVYSFENNNNHYIINSFKKVFKYEDLNEKGFILRNNNYPSMCHFRAKSAVDFVNGIKNLP